MIEGHIPNGQPRRSIPNAGLQILIAITLLLLFGGSPAYGESFYSDAWLDDSDPEQGYLFSAGVAEGIYTHEYYIDTYFNSPNGRGTSGSSPQGR